MVKFSTLYAESSILTKISHAEGLKTHQNYDSKVGRPDASGEDKEEDDCEGDDNAVEDDQGRRVLDFDLIPAAVAREDVKSSFSNADHHGKRSSGAEAVKQKAPITVLAGVPKENIEDCYLVDRELSVTYLCIDRDTRELLACKSISKRGCSGSSVRLSTSRMFAATYELKNYQAPPGKLSTRDLNTSLSPKSQEKAKQIMLEYAGSEHGQGDTDLDSYFSHTSSPGSEDFDNTSSIDSFMSKHSSVSKKTSLIQKLKKWGKSKDDSSALSSPARYLSGGSPSRMNMSSRPRDSLELLMQRNASDSVAITTFGPNDQEPSNSVETLALPSIRRVSSCESLNSVASSFQLMSKTVVGHLDGKYPAYKDRHKLASEREKQIKEKAEKARVQKFGDNSNLNMSKAERERTVSLPSKLTQLKEKTHVCGSSNDHLREHRQREIVEAAASARANEGNPAANICCGNFVEQFSRVGELATAHVEGYEVRSNYVFEQFS
ncbi:Protein CHUP1-like protein [Vigna angularis]|uniref:Protein CHUP1-like protein n=1 Tax=Phaseolus angularis TaxID=3914 RepID=A0A8T0K0A4_PHAAN|nr:Protein CHUP1-like protein [Vigna angularis]